ncbi:MAG: hypothetical protein ABJH72_17745 [Reichenbachiella sp.]|uniref:hypothetical protein n=1 Tax=Reichenbachiella sp. TaxID=2184521 RepID=UPI0032642DD5
MEDSLLHHQIRPRFRIETSLTPAEIETKLSKSVSEDQESVGGKVIPGHATLTLPERDQHYWSPQLTLSFEEAEGQCLLRGMYSPRPAVWTMFVLFYSVVAFASLVISIVGYSKWSLGQSAGILWLVPVLMVIFLSLYLVSYTGQKVGRKQMITLHNFVEETLGINIREE